jgi:hypothetical protein
MPDHEIKKDQRNIRQDKQDVREAGQEQVASPMGGGQNLSHERKDLHQDKHEIQQDRRDERRDNH